MKQCRFILIALCLFSAFSFAEESDSSTDAGKTSLAVHVENGTKGGIVQHGTRVTVSFYRGGDLIKQVPAQTDDGGSCTIEDIPTGESVVAVAQAKHDNMAFSSAPLKLQSQQQTYELSFNVFDIAYDSSLVRIGTHHLILKQDGPRVIVEEYVQLINDSDKAILSEEKDSKGLHKVIKMSLPSSFADLTFSNYFIRSAIIKTETGFYDTMAVPPGISHAVFSYVLQPRSDAVEFKKTVTLKTDRIMLFIQNPQLTVKGLDASAGKMTLNDGTSVDYYTVDAAKDSVLQFQLNASFAPRSSHNFWIVLAVVFALVILLAVFRLRKI